MHRITITLPDELDWELEREARRRQTSVSAIVREALQEKLNYMPGLPRDIPWIGIGESGHTDTAERFDEILAESWSDAIDRRG